MKKYGNDDLIKARNLQHQCLELNIPSPPVTLWDIKVTNKEGEIKEHIQSKSNSYVRNSYNLIAQMITYAKTKSTTVFGDGVISFKANNGNLTEKLAYYSSAPFVEDFNVDMYFGSGTTPDVMNDFKLETPVTWAINGQWGEPKIKTIFENKKLITTISKDMVNNTGSPVSFSEVGLFGSVRQSPSLNNRYSYLLIRDVFPNITIEHHELLAFTYQTEIIMP